MTLTQLQQSGIAQEKPLAYVLKSWFGKERVKHNDFSPSKYPLENGLIVDCEVREKALIESTNPKETTFMNNEIMLNKLDYFKRRDPFHLMLWILVISFANFSKFIADKIEEMGIHLVVTRIHADKNNFRVIMNRLLHSKLYYLLKKLKKKLKPHRAQKFLSSYVNVVSSNTVSNNIIHNRPIIVSKHLHQHGINEDILSFIVKIKDKETERLRKLYDG